LEAKFYFYMVQLRHTQTSWSNDFYYVIISYVFS
jgi:hypothetical protein